MDLPAGFERRCKQFLDDFPEAMSTFETLVTGNTIWQSRTKGIGMISAEDAIDWGLTGPCLRGSGVEHRRPPRQIRTRATRHTISIFRRNPTAMSGRDSGCGCARWYESHKIVDRHWSGLKPGPIKADAPKVVLPDRDDMRKHMDSLIHHFLIVAEGFNVPAGEVYMPIEASKGELGVYMRSNGGPKPDRVHFRGPSFVNLRPCP